jgi:hypothetical protein
MKIKQFVNNPKEKFLPERAKIGIFPETNGGLPAKYKKYARFDPNCCKIGEMTIKTYKTNGNKGRMTKYATKL